MPLEVLQNWELIQLIVTPNILGKVQGQIKEVCRLIELCLLIGTREYTLSPILVLLSERHCESMKMLLLTPASDVAPRAKYNNSTTAIGASIGSSTL